MAHTKEFQITALNYAKEIGSIPQAAQYFGVDTRTMYRWNDEHKICPINKIRTFTEDQKCEILSYANKYGLTGAMREFNVDIATQLTWNKTRNIYEPTGRREDATHVKQYERISEAEKKEILCFARDYGVTKASQKYNKPTSTIQLWNGIYKIYKQRKHRVFTPEQKENIIQYANDTSIAEAAKKFRLYGHQIQRWIDDKARSER